MRRVPPVPPDHKADLATIGGDVTLGEVQRTLARIEVRMDQIVADHEHRLRRVERWVYMLPPAVLMAAGSVIIAVIRGGP
jgi:hypothetical protein